MKAIEKAYNLQRSITLQNVLPIKIFTQVKTSISKQIKESKGEWPIKCHVCEKKSNKIPMNGLVIYSVGLKQRF